VDSDNASICGDVVQCCTVAFLDASNYKHFLVDELVEGVEGSIMHLHDKLNGNCHLQRIKISNMSVRIQTYQF
jgi:hypothetical protein